MSRDVRRLAGWVIDPLGMGLQAAGVHTPLPNPATLLNPPRRAVPTPAPPPDRKPPPVVAAPEGRVTQAPAPAPPTPAPLGPKAQAAPVPEPRSGAGASADRTRGLVNPRGTRTLLG